MLNFYSPLWVKIAWYIGTIGFALYFWHRSSIQKKRAELVGKYELRDAIATASYDNNEQQQALKYIIDTTETSKSRFNSLFIFVLSVAALVVGVILDIRALV